MGEGACASMNSSMDSNLQKIAVFDLDGTSISRQSGHLFSTYLFHHGYISKRNALKLYWWGVRYILHLPHSQEESRELIFSGLKKLPGTKVDEIMHDFHEEVIKKYYRRDAIAEVRKRQSEGYVCILVSAAFEGLAKQAARFMGMDGYVATRMEVDEQGNYTGRMLGKAVEGPQKPCAVRKWANEHFGEGRWVLECAYGDHYSDTALLSEATHGFAVRPKWVLRKNAEKYGFKILNWN